MNNKIGIIIGREFNERVRKKSFILTTLLTPLLIIGLMITPMLIMNYSDGEEKRIIVIDDSGVIAPYLHSNDEVCFEPMSISVDNARKEFKEHFAVLHIGKEIVKNPGEVRMYTNQSASIMLEENIATLIEMAIESERLKEFNIENLPLILASIEADVTLQSFKNEESDSDMQEAKSSSSAVATVMAYVLSFMLYMFLIIYGAMVMQSVIEEKNSRVLEVMVSSVRPFDMMLGKILGVASVAVLQIVIWIALIAIVGYFVVPSVMPEEITAALAMMKQGMAVENGTDIGLLQALVTLTDVKYLVTIFASLLLFVVGGFLLYAALFAAVGSAVDNVQDAQQLQLPITLPIILGLLIMMVVINDPTSGIAFWFSMIPFTSPIVMMARIPYEIPMWEIIVSLLLLYATFVGAVWMASKIYRVGILMHGKKPSFKELWRWMRYKY
ncbi:MAG: ABC transporter permease [Bacteroidaceae bacterium]|nr:ABC transporter permease [Bacteroidaceae bacterium]